MIQLFLTNDVEQRLLNINNIKNHDWFEGINWRILLKQKVKAPIIPEISFSGNTSNFDNCPSITLNQSESSGSELNANYEGLFDGF